MAIEYKVKYEDYVYFLKNKAALYANGRDIGAAMGDIWGGDNLEFRASDGYRFDVAPYLELNSGRRYPFTKVDDYKYSLKAPNGSSGGGYKGFVVATVEDKPPEPVKPTVYTFTNEDYQLFAAKMISATINSATIQVGTEWKQDDTLRLSALNADDYFEYAQVILGSGLTDLFTIDETGKTARYTAKEEIQAIDFDIEVRAFEAFKVKQSDIDSFTSTGVKGWINDIEMKVDDVVHVNDTIKFTVIDVSKHVITSAAIKYGTKSKSMTVAVDKRSASLQWTTRDLITGFNILVDNINQVIYRHTQTMVDLFTSQHAQLRVDGKVIGLNGEIYQKSLIEIVCDNGFTFTSKTPSIVTSDMLTGDDKFTAMDVNNERTIASYTYLSSTYIDRFDFETQSTSFIAYTVTQASLNNFAENGVRGFINDSAMKVGDIINLNDTIKFTIIDTALTAFDSVYIEANGQQYPMNIDLGKTIATQQWTVRQVITGFLFNITGLFPVVYTHDQTAAQYFSDRHASLYANGRLIGVGGQILKNDKIEIKCDADYEFMTGEDVIIRSYIAYYMDVNSTRKIAVKQYNYADEIYNFEFTTVKTTVVDTDTTNNTYELTPREFRNLESLELREWNTDGDVINDYTSLLVGVMRFPFAIPDEYKGEYGGIYLGHKQFDEVKGTDITEDFVTIDLGKIKVEPQFNDLRDYANTTAILRLPHLSSVNLDLEYVINQEVGVKYYVNLSNGETVVIITSSALESESKTLLTLNATLGTQMPIAHKEGNAYKPLDTNNMRIGGDNEIMKPTIDIVRNDIVNGDSMFTIPVKDSGKLTDFKGWTKIDDIVLTLNATQREKQEIVALLKQGVFFNDD
nr:poly(beta-D-mannuronate) lyase [Acinetobacter phage Phanie]